MSLRPDLRGFVDYDREHLRGLTNNQRIEYFELRVSLVVLNPLKRILDTEIVLPAEAHSSAILIFGVSICCAIEAFGKFMTGGVGSKAGCFYTFLRWYMNPDFRQRLRDGIKYEAALWKYFRNGIAHGFTVCHGGFEGAQQEPYFLTRRIAGHDALELNPTRFFEDFQQAVAKYIADLRSASPGDDLFVNFAKTFEKVFVNGD